MGETQMFKFLKDWYACLDEDERFYVWMTIGLYALVLLISLINMVTGGV